MKPSRHTHWTPNRPRLPSIIITLPQRPIDHPKFVQSSHIIRSNLACPDISFATCIDSLWATVSQSVSQ